jgi:hypothetical protein
MAGAAALPPARGGRRFEAAMPPPRNAGPPFTPWLLIALAIAVVIHATMGAPGRVAGKDARQSVAALAPAEQRGRSERQPAASEQQSDDRERRTMEIR